ncbi:MAG: glycosyltransferase [Gemmatimonadaceae bacterium]
MLNLTGGGLSGGYRKYLQHIVPAFQSSSAVSELLVAVPPGQESGAGNSNVVFSWVAGEQWRGFNALRKRVVAWKPDVVLIPTARYLDCGVPVVAMVRNMEPMLSPNLRDGVTSWARNYLGAHLARRAVTKAQRVIAVSQFVREFLKDEWRVDDSKIGVVYHGVDEAAYVAVTPTSLNALTATPFLFAAGSLLPYRGIEDAIRALSMVNNPKTILAVAGNGSERYRSALTSLAAELQLDSRIRWLGHLDETEMRWAYQRCVAFLMTSRVEACPNTALEAMANGALCISTDSPPMPEFFRDTAQYFKPNDAPTLAALIEDVLVSSPQVIVERRSAARARAVQFKWSNTVAETIAQLQRALT